MISIAEDHAVHGGSVAGGIITTASSLIALGDAIELVRVCNIVIAGDCIFNRFTQTVTDIIVTIGDLCTGLADQTIHSIIVIVFGLTEVEIIKGAVDIAVEIVFIIQTECTTRVDGVIAIVLIKLMIQRQVVGVDQCFDTAKRGIAYVVCQHRGVAVVAGGDLRDVTGQIVVVIDHTAAGIGHGVNAVR